MTRHTTLVTLAILSSILTPVVVRATVANQDTSVPQQPNIEVAAVASSAPPPEGQGCRRVKVVYAGYGEAHAAACAAAETRR